MNVVWFKRDLRLHDHLAFSNACISGPVIALYILEPELWSQPDMSMRHYDFLEDCLQGLRQDLAALDMELVVRVGDAVDVLHDLYRENPFTTLWSHQETWNGWTYQRDLRVRQWVHHNGVVWQEPAQNGVIRRLQDRDGWAQRWYAVMKEPIVPLASCPNGVNAARHPLPDPGHLGLRADGCFKRQRGGRRRALQDLNSFLYERGEGYAKEMSSPLTGYTSCSRLSAHLAFGTISMREVFQAVERRKAELREIPPAHRGKWLGALNSFGGRLRWHCHFMQKLEDEPEIEFRALHPAYVGVREHDFDEGHFKAWQEGRTGFPMVDACMRALIATGWLNFRMRALLMSFASYHLWLHWRRPALHLARLFTDYEPGIHYSQVQMQSGTTGINSIRIYNPVKQGIDQDPEGIFIRQWIPELRALAAPDCHMPWQVPALMNGYPLPIVDEKQARKAAADKLYSLRKNPEHRTLADQVIKKHASRKNRTKAKGQSKTQKKRDDRQGELLL